MIGKSFIDLFEEQVIKTPGDTAVVFQDQQLNYQQLNEAANQFAHYLRKKGVVEDALVPLYMERGIQMIVAMLAIMKAGGAYVPIDTDFPPGRISFMLEDTGANLVISSTQSREKLPVLQGMEIMTIEAAADQPTINLATRVLPAQLAYVIYTSGSTGQPKGVMIEHGSLVDYIVGLSNKTNLAECRSFALVSTIATDLGNTVIYGSLATGGALHLFTKESVSNIEYLHHYFATNTIDCLKIVPSHWKVLNQDDKLLLPRKLLVFGGEALQEKIIENIQSTGTHCTIVNHYGPTETTIGKLLYIVERGTKHEYTVPIGKPFSNTKVLVLTKNLKLCPIGVPGQLYITGDGLARGYWKRPGLTAEKFISNPFSKQSHTRMYGTGDLVKYLPDGNIVFIGRADNQVKIRGYRIELGEIENVIQQSELVSQAVVLANDDKQGNKRLVGYIVPEHYFDKDGIQAYLKDKLPDYMIPAILIEMDQFPLTANGKIDRNALPDPDMIDATPNQYVAPRNEIESRLALIWQEILEVDQVGINDDFFELGGHSLLAVRLVSAIRKSFTVEMPIGDIFDYPTVALLATQLPNQSDETVLPVIEKVLQKPERIPLSFSQERLWFIDQLDGSLQYHIPAVLRLKGRLNIAALSNAIQQIINRHEVLRTVLPQQEGLAYQFIRQINQWQLPIIDGSTYQHDTTGLHHYIKQCIDKPFNLEADDMLRVSLLRINETEHVLLAVLHHIASDGWSAAIMVNELVELYNAFAENRPANLKPLPIQYSDYAIWQRAYLAGEVLANKVGYWKKQLAGVSPLQLPTDRKRPAIQSTAGSIKAFAIDKSLSDQLQTIGKLQGATLFMTLLSTFKVLLYRYSGQQDICVGTPVAGRQQQETESLIGFFVNTIAIRSAVNGNDSFLEILRQVRTTTLDAYAHQELPFEKVVEAVVTERDLGRSPVFQVMFVLQNTPPIPELMLGDVAMQPEKFDHTVSMFDLSLSIKEGTDGLIGHMEYNSDLFDEQTILRMINHYTQLLHSIVAQPEERTGWLTMLTAQEQQQLLKTFNDSKVDYPKNTTVVSLFEDQVRKTPNKIAVFFEGQQLSYDEVNRRSNQVARFLKSKGVGQNTFVPFCINRSMEMIVSILGILKAGGAYVPVDPDYPSERIAHMLLDTAAPMVLSNLENREQLQVHPGIEIIDVNNDWETIAKYGEENLEEVISPNQLAYIIYTSGSTGTPKGVMIEHASLTNYVQMVTRYFSITAEDNVIQQSSPSFDTLVEEIYPALTSGATLYVIREGGRDIAGIKKYIENNTITILTTTPIVVEYLNKELTHIGKLRYLIVGGDVLYSSHITNFFGKVKIVNGYGPSETTVCATYNTIEHIDEATVIGRPIDNARVYILSPEGQLVPEGVSGEICVAGTGLARGYLNNPGLTAQKFVPNPFEPDASSKMYKTGDAGRWLRNGKIDYLGRIDEQVKIRGYRVELSEIQHVLQQSGLVADSVILAKNDLAGRKRLVGYIVPFNNDFDKEAVESYLSSKLPVFMIPSVWVKLDSFPVTANGKLDKKNLPDPGLEQISEDHYKAPRNKWEEQLAVIWQDLLGVPRVGVEDNFFELGGDSILTIQLVSRANRLGYSLQARDIFLYQDIARLSKAFAERIDQASLGEQGKLTGAVGLLPIQQWYLQTTGTNLSHYNQAVLLTVDKMLEAAIFDEALTQLMLHHDALRLKFHRESGQWHQEYGNHQSALIIEDLRSTGQQFLSTTIAKLADRYQQQLGIEKGELVKLIWIQTPATEAGNRLLIIVHHLAIDGVSWRILLEDLDVLITASKKQSAASLGTKTSSYRQWFQALEKYRHTDRLKAQSSYWKKVENRYTAIPVDKEFATTLQVKDISSFKLEMAEKYTKNLLQDISKAYNTDINDILLCALALTFCNYSNADSIVIGLEGHGREDLEKDINISRTVGWFTTLYPVLLEADPARNIPSMIKGIKEQLRSVPDKGIGYGVLKYIHAAELTSQPACWDILFNYLGQSDNLMAGNQWMSLAKESVGSVKSATHPVSEKLTITGWIQHGRLLINWEYSDRHFLSDTIIGLAKNYLANLESLISHCLEQQKSGSVYTPSDYGLGSDVSVEELDNFLEDEETDNIISF